MKSKQVVNVEQLKSKSTDEKDVPGFQKSDLYIYSVKSLKNTLKPAIGSLLSRLSVEELIVAGVDVNVLPHSK